MAQAFDGHLSERICPEARRAREAALWNLVDDPSATQHPGKGAAQIGHFIMTGCAKDSLPAILLEMTSAQEPFGTGDPVADLILTGRASTVEEAEELYLDSNIDEVIRLVNGPMSDEELRRHPLIHLLLSKGSRPWEDSLR
jgi:hypothetical protein